MSDEVKIPLPRSLQEIVGALLFASETPLTANEIRDAIRAVEPVDGDNSEMMDVYRTCTSKEISEALRGLEKALDVAGAGFSLVCTGNAYRLQSAPSCGRYVRALLKMDRPNRLGRASLETLAIVAYRQPITKSEIEQIRGVDVSANIKTLMDLQLIRLVGKSELPGHPFLYGTTPLFLEHFGLSSLEQLNELDPTLQRSNPRKKALDYKRKADEKSAAKEDEEKNEAHESESSSASSLASEEEIEEAVVTAPENIQDEEDDLFIDDTPDEFDDDDDDDDDDDFDSFDDEDEDDIEDEEEEDEE
jgi:segregation and condensation protein B